MASFSITWRFQLVFHEVGGAKSAFSIAELPRNIMADKGLLPQIKSVEIGSLREGGAIRLTSFPRFSGEEVRY